MHKTLKFLAILLLCVFTSPSFAGDGGGDGGETTVECMIPEHDSICLDKNSSCNTPGTTECSNYGNGYLGCYVEGRLCQVECNICTSTECPEGEGYPRWDDQWTSAGDGYEKKNQIGLNTICQEEVVDSKYRCAAGYYGQSDDGVTGCYQCPSWNSCPATSNAGSTTIVQCYVPGYNSETGECSVPFEDETGSGNMWFGSNCNHE